jgi:hypothetical protein
MGIQVSPEAVGECRASRRSDASGFYDDEFKAITQVLVIDAAQCSHTDSIMSVAFDALEIRKFQWAYNATG